VSLIRINKFYLTLFQLFCFYSNWGQPTDNLQTFSKYQLQVGINIHQPILNNGGWRIAASECLRFASDILNRKRVYVYTGINYLRKSIIGNEFHSFKRNFIFNQWLGSYNYDTLNARADLYYISPDLCGRLEFTQRDARIIPYVAYAIRTNFLFLFRKNSSYYNYSLDWLLPGNLNIVYLNKAISAGAFIKLKSMGSALIIELESNNDGFPMFTSDFGSFYKRDKRLTFKGEGKFQSILFRMGLTLNIK
jgi:hypothetical protein